MRKLVGIALVVAGTAACSSPLGPGEALDVTVSEVVWRETSSGFQAVTAMTVENVGTKAEFLARCGGRMLDAVDRFVDGEWVNVKGAGCNAAVSHAPIRLEPGESRTQLVGFRAEGKHRVVVFVHERALCTSTLRRTCAGRRTEDRSATVEVPARPEP